jgi:anti-sigma factor RsiW
MSHFDEMTCLLYLEGQLDADHAEGVRTHAAGCAECRGLLRALQTESVWLRESLEADDESVPARLVQAPEHGGAPWGWISALGLSAGGAYTLWS